MVNNIALDVAIGLILMYLMLSLMCTVINEFIATQLNLRAKSLAAALVEMLDDPTVRNAFYDHGLIASTKTTLQNAGTMLWKATLPFISNPVTAATPAAPPTPRAAPTTSAPPAGALAPAVAAPGAANAVAPAAAPAAAAQPGDHPSYISADVFVQALIGGLSGTRLAGGQPVPTFADIQAAIEKLPPSNIKSALLSSLVIAHGDIDIFREDVAGWFDDSMERLSGAYKRHLKLISIVVALIVSIGFNADTFGVASALWNDPALRDSVVAAATDAVKTSSATSGQCQVTTPAAVPAGATANANVNLDQMKRSVQETEDCLRPLPLGWSAAKWAAWTSWPWLAIVGWIVTALALSLGAPFWFDLLSKFVNIRGTGPKPERADARQA